MIFDKPDNHSDILAQIKQARKVIAATERKDGGRRNFMPTPSKVIGQVIEPTYKNMNSLVDSCKSSRVRRSVEASNSSREVFCACEKSEQLSLSEAAYLSMMDLGCGRLDCTVTDLRELVWKSPEAALELQHSTLLMVKPDEVQSFWGGKADDAYSFSYAEGLNNFKEYCRRFIGNSEGRWWVHRKNKHLPFLEGNLKFTKFAEKFFKSIDKQLIAVDGGEMYIEELCSLTNNSVDYVLKYLHRNRGSLHIIEDLL